MKLKILEKSNDRLSEGRSYQGLDRKAPYYVGEINDSDQANQAFYKYVDKATLRGVLGELDFCRHIIYEYSRLKPPIEFEIVEITIGNETPESKDAEFLGFEVACVYRISLLTYVLHLGPELRVGQLGDDISRVIQTLFRLAHIYFRPKLNRNGLFDDQETASFYLDCMMALQHVKPNLWEGDDCEFEVIGVWRVI